MYQKWLVYRGKIPSRNGWFGGTPMTQETRICVAIRHDCLSSTGHGHGLVGEIPTWLVMANPHQGQIVCKKKKKPSYRSPFTTYSNISTWYIIIYYIQYNTQYVYRRYTPLRALDLRYYHRSHSWYPHEQMKAYPSQRQHVWMDKSC